MQVSRAVHRHWSFGKCGFQHVSCSLAVSVGWTETFPCETLQAAVMLRCLIQASVVLI